MARFEAKCILSTMKILVSASFLLNVGAEIRENDSSLFLTFNCTASTRHYTAVASSDWQFVGVRGAIDGDCHPAVSIPVSGVAQPPSPLQPLLLLKMDSLQLQPPDRRCDNTATSLQAYADQIRTRTGYVCSLGASAAWYLWTSESLRLYLYIQNTLAGSGASAYPTAAFNLAFVIVPALNVCGNRNASIELIVVNMSFAFAPDARYAGIPPNNVSCPHSNYTLAIAAASASSQLAVSVLAAPSIGSCWGLFYRGQRCNDSDTYYAPPNQTVQLIYSRNCQQAGTGMFDGFTINISSSGFAASQAPTIASSSGAAGEAGELNTSLSTSISLSAAAATTDGSAAANSPNVRVVAGASAAAAVTVLALLTGLTAWAVMRRRRRQFRQPAPRVNSAGLHGAQPPLVGTVAADDYGYHQYAPPVPPVSASPILSDRLYFVLADASQQAHVGTPLEGLELGADRNVRMVDNDLYGTAFGS